MRAAKQVVIVVDVVVTEADVDMERRLILCTKNVYLRLRDTLAAMAYLLTFNGLRYSLRSTVSELVPAEICCGLVFASGLFVFDPFLTVYE